ncbi:MAG TPA: NPCBM/NEW2 domain-containing protein, partial [Pirellulaceae bacterium]|nr:NPCBM/NEW2 domain-containing protein [Pirellulaceae bacterium]
MPYLTLNSPRFGGRRRSRPARRLPSQLPVAMASLLFATSLMAWLGFAGRSSDGTARAAERPPRFGALMSNGSRLGGLQLSQSAPPVNDWQLDKQPLLGDDNPLRWLRDRTLAPGSPPAAFVELVTGDRLPGTVVGFVDGSRNPFDSDPPHFVVRAETTLVPPLPQREPLVRVVSRFVRRLVWQRRETEQLAPSTLFYRDGRQLTFRAIRYSESGVSLLVADGQRKVAYSEIAEVHLPAVDGWDAYLDELSALCPSGTGRLLQLETVDGLIATTSRDRLRLSAPGGPQDGTRWVQGVQPAWSLDVLWVPQSSCWIVRSFGANEVPLSRIVPDAARYKAWLTGVGPPARVNRNVRQGLLRSGGLEFGWGLGVHASTQLVFKLPSYATTFHSWVGLDRLSGRGGCIRARVLIEGQAAPLFDSGFLVGSEVVSETGHVILPAGDSRKLVLDIDAAHEGRPAGADPFDIRDVADWLEPIVQLDASALAAELAPRVQRHMSAWQGWTVRVQPRPQVERGSLEWSTIWDEGAPSPGRFLLGAAAKDGTLELEREISVTADEPWLVVATSQLAATSPPQQLEVAVDGQPIADSNLVLRTAGQRDPPPLIVPLVDYAGRRIRVTLRLPAAPWTPPAPPTQPPPSKPAVPSVSPPCVWRLARTTEQLPTLY